MSSKTATSSSNMAAETDSKRIEYVQVYQAKLAMTAYRGYKIRLYNVLFMIGYVVVGGWVVSTIGQPYRQFLEKADREGFQVMEGATKFRAELEHSVRGLNDPDRRTEKLGWFAWMDMDIEELAAEKKRDKEKSVLDSIPKGQRVPAKHAAGFWPSLVLGVVTCFHALVLLLQHWSVGWNVRMNYREMDASTVQIPESMMELSDDELEREMAKSSSNGTNTAAATASSSNNHHASRGGGNAATTKDAANTSLLVPDRVIRNVPAHLPTHARICPTKKGQRHVLIPLEYYPVLGMTFEYHRRRYVYDGETDTWHKIRCRTTGLSLEVLAEDWTGLESPAHIIGSQIRHGPNMFSVRQPAFWDLYQRQLLNPFSVFQIFCVLLWAIDDYILYSCFSLWMVLMFEGTVVFQRIKSLQALTGMGNPSRHVYAYRCKRWIQLDTTELLPADICSLTRHKPHMAKAAGTADKRKDDSDKTKTEGEETRALTQNKKKPAPPRSMKIEDEGGDIVPADLLLLRGCTVVNEASLTGESVPQMKEGLSEISPGETLAVKGQHKMNVVYAGTKMLQCQGETTTTTAGDGNSNDESQTTNDDDKTRNKTTKSLYAQIPDPPDGGCVCFVLRTGFASAQGKLVRMIEGSQEKVKGHERETGLLLLLLCFFAVCSSSYVLYHGIHQENRSKYELLLHCIMIVTSVIRPELPMQMALAVNNSLMTLMKMHVFCTEPYRVPVAGKLDACLFDKTGTLTTDELAAVGVCEPDQLSHIPKTSSKTAADQQQQGENDQNENAGKDLLTPMAKVSAEAALVLAGCHSLVQVDGETVGDPLESAALKAMRWHVDPETGRVVPNVAEDPGKANSHAGKPIRLRQLHSSTTGGPLSELTVLTRHHFSSKLQRMSCVVRTNTGHAFAVAKGSPEAIGKLLAKNSDDDENSVNPALDRYMAAAEYFAKQGYRVICLACRCLSTPGDVQAARDARSECERDLVFCGLIAFACMVRKDTKQVLSRLKQGGMTVSMVTGDAILTAIHVAKLTGIYEPLGGGGGGGGANGDGSAGSAEEQNQELRALLESKKKGKSGHQQRPKKQKAKPPSEVFRPILYLDLADEGALYWAHYEDGTKAREFRAADIPTLAETYDLATTGRCLAAAYEQDADTTKQLMHIKVFARMTPDAKETVIEHLHAMDKLCLMCGDGANDVGALKQADVGVALLSGFGNLNVDKTSAGDDEDKKNKEKKDNAGEVTAIMSREHLEELRAMPVGLLKWKIRSIGVDPNKYPDLVEKEDLVQLYQIKARELAVKRHDAKNAKEKSKLSKREQQEEQRAMIREKQARMQRRAEELAAAGESFATFKALREFMSSEMAEAKAKKGELARMHGVEGSAATLAAKLDQMETNELPMVKLGDASIAAPFTSKMPSVKSCVDIVRQGRCTLVSSIQMYQIMALQCLISSYSLSVLYLDGVKYGDSQLTAMGLLGMVSFMSVSRSKPLDKLSRVRPLNTIFHPALFCSLLGQFAIHLSTMVLAVRTAKSHLPPDFVVDLDGEFKPGILNTTVFLVSGVQQVTVFFVNLQGRPFMTGITENRPLLWSLAITFILTFMFASETVPGLNRYFQLVPFPDQGFRDFLLILLVLNLAATFAFDRLMQFFFARDILRASVEGTKWSDVFGLIRTFAVIGIIMQVFLGNSETWDQLLEMEKEMEEMAAAAGEEAANDTTATATATLEAAANLANATVNATTATAAAALDAVGEAVTECVGAACAAAAAAAAATAMNETASAVVREEL